MAPPRTISRERFDQLANVGKEIITESSEPSGLSPDVALEAGVEQQQPDTSPEAATPPATPVISVEAPVVNVEAPVVMLRPEITVQPTPVTVQVASPDMKPIADAMADFGDAILESINSQQQPAIHVQAPTINMDLTPIADAISSMAAAINDKPDHVGEITAMLQKIADRPQNAKWKFVITRDAKGDIETMDAVKEMTV